MAFEYNSQLTSGDLCSWAATKTTGKTVGVLECFGSVINSVNAVMCLEN